VIDPERLTSDVERLIEYGRNDVGRWMANGLGIYLHDKQLEVIEALYNDPATYYLLWWANRVGKTTVVIPWHLHGIFYKYEIPEPRTDREYKLWLAEDYRTLHTAPLATLALRLHAAIKEIGQGTHPAQRSDDGERRDAPLGAFFTVGTERNANGGEHPVVKCLTGGTVDLYSTEGGGGRIEGTAWRRGSWDEWPQQEGSDLLTQIREVLTRLTNRVSDFDGKLLITGTVTEDTEGIAKDWIALCDDPQEPDWWGSSATRMDNPHASRKAIEIAKRNFDDEDYKRSVLGQIGGVKGRLIPSYMTDPAFVRDLPRETPPHPEDRPIFDVVEMPRARVRRAGREVDDEEPVRGRYKDRGTSPYYYIHAWDLAIAAADNVGLIFRIPANYEFSVENPIIGVRRIVIHGSRTLTPQEILTTIEGSYLLYGGQIVLDTTDAHGKGHARDLKSRGYPVESFTFNERDPFRKIIRKEAAILHTREILTEGMDTVKDAAGEPVLDSDGVPVMNHETTYGAIRCPKDWVRTRDQLSVLKVDDDKQRKDEAMAFLMGCDTAYRLRRSRTRRNDHQRFAMFAGGRRYGGV
jgi:hypothetical protein